MKQPLYSLFSTTDRSALAQAGGAIEIIDPKRTGWLCPPANPDPLAAQINLCYEQPQLAATVAQAGYLEACQRFAMATIQQQLAELLTATTL